MADTTTVLALPFPEGADANDGTAKSTSIARFVVAKIGA